MQLSTKLMRLPSTGLLCGLEVANFLVASPAYKGLIQKLMEEEGRVFQDDMFQSFITQRHIVDLGIYQMTVNVTTVLKFNPMVSLAQVVSERSAGCGSFEVTSDIVEWAENLDPLQLKHTVLVAALLVCEVTSVLIDDFMDNTSPNNAVGGVEGIINRLNTIQKEVSSLVAYSLVVPI